MKQKERPGDVKLGKDLMLAVGFEAMSDHQPRNVIHPPEAENKQGPPSDGSGTECYNNPPRNPEAHSALEPPDKIPGWLTPHSMVPKRIPTYACWLGFQIISGGFKKR